MTRLLPGSPHPLGATYDGGGTNFAVHSDVAESIAVCIFGDDGGESQFWLSHRTGSVHHGYLTGVAPGTAYGLRVDGPWAPNDGLWCNPAKLLIDPYAHAVTGNIDWDRAVYGFSVQDPDAPEPHDSAPHMPRNVVVDHAFDWDGDTAPATPWADTVIYETHVKSLSQRHPQVPAALRGTYLGVSSEPILRHLLELGVTAVELLPVQQFIHDHALVRRGLRNHWGYQPIAFFAPHHEYASRPGAQVDELKTMVKELHAAGIEVILDVVFNHTGESHHLGPNLSYRGIDNHAYYRLSDEDPRHYLDFSGVGNTINTDHPATLRMIADSLRHWVETYHVDGFRFDLASTLARHRLEFDPGSPFLQLVHQDPVLNRIKLIAEPWDVGPGGYRLGGFPPEWREWNDRYRDTMRDFWRTKRGTLGEFASRLTGSADIFRSGGRLATASINFITSHDGYTLADLVSYEQKHNHANGHGNQDGNSDNRSWNTGVEGPTNGSTIVELRRRRRRSLYATLLLSQGVPMLLGGDELGRSQDGNNNAYAQDNDVSWYQWEEADDGFLEFARRMVRIRRTYAVLTSAAWLDGDNLPNGFADVVWIAPDGDHMTVKDWRRPAGHAVGMLLNGAAVAAAAGEAHTVLALFNSGHDPIAFALPTAGGAAGWRLILDTARPDAGEEEAAAGATFSVGGFGVALFERIDGS